MKIGDRVRVTTDRFIEEGEVVGFEAIPLSEATWVLVRFDNKRVSKCHESRVEYASVAAVEKA